MALGAEVFKLFGSIGVDTSEAEQGLDNVARSGRRTADDLNTNTGRGLSNFGAKSAAIMGAIAGAAQVAFTKIAAIVTDTIGAAVRRVDTLNNANLVFKNMGFSADDTKTAMTRLKDSILGLPTALNDAVTGVQSLAATSGDLLGSQKVYQALNDGILAFGGSAVEVNGAITQLSQLPLDGPLDAQTWLSLRNNGLTPVLAAIAKDSGRTMGQLKDDFSSGKLTVADFNNMLVKLDKDGGGGMASLQKQAHDATSGIQTGWANMQTAITRGVADIIQAIGSKNISGAISWVGSVLETVLKGISAGVNAAKPVVEGFGKSFTFLTQPVKDLQTFFRMLFDTITGGDPTLFKGEESFTKISKALTYFYDPIQNVQTVLRMLFDTVTGGDPTIKKGEEGFSGFAKTLWTVRDNVLGFVDVIKGAFASAIKAIPSVIAGTIDTVRKVFDFLWPSIQTLFTTIVNNFLPALGKMWDAVVKLWNALNPALIDALKIIAELIGAVMVSGIYIAINSINIFYNVLSFLVSVLATVVTWLANVIKWIGDFIGALVKAYLAVKSWVDSMVNALVGGFNGLKEALTAVWNAMWNGILAALQFVWQTILDFLTITVGIPLAIINTFLIQPLLAAWGVLWPTIHKAFTDAWNGMLAFITPAVTAIHTAVTTGFNAARDAIKAALDAAHTAVTIAWNAITNAVSAAVNWVRSTVTDAFNGTRNNTISAWDGIRNAIAGPINSARDIVRDAINAIRSFFNFRISWPHIPLPHFSLNPRGWQIGDLLKGKIPSLGIDWYAKGGILDGPTLFGLNGNSLMGGGEAGREAVLPLNRETLGGIGHGIADTMGAGNDSALLKSLLDEVKQLRKDQANTQLVMDTGALVGAIRKEVDRQLQNDSTLRLRGVTT